MYVLMLLFLVIVLSHREQKDSRDKLELLVSKEIRWSPLHCFKYSRCNMDLQSSVIFIQFFFYVNFQGSGGAPGKEGLTGLDGEEVD